MDLEKQQDELYRARVEKLERETKERQDGDRRKIADLEAKNKELARKLEEQKSKLREAESKCKDTEMLKALYEEKAEKLKEDLKVAENEFKLNAETTEF